jgi:hypothetical protein
MYEELMAVYNKRAQVFYLNVRFFSSTRSFYLSWIELA